MGIIDLHSHYRDELYLESEQKLRRRIYYLITEKAQKFNEEISWKIASLFGTLVKRNLIDYANDENFGPADWSSKQKIYDLVRGINVETSSSVKGGYKTTIRNDREGLLMFIEYGTGWLGDSFNSEFSQYGTYDDSEDVSWGYMLNSDYYINDKYFIFDKDSKDYNPYIAKTDFEPTRLTYKKTRKNRYGEYVEKTYIRKSFTHKGGKPYTAIMSKGLAPSHAIYDARMIIKMGIKAHKTASELNNWLDMMIEKGFED